MVTRICIVGGGTAGWLSAAVLSHDLSDVEITVIDSPDIPTIGVGEGTFPSTMCLLRRIGLSTNQIMRGAHAGIKLGIQYKGFTPEPFWLCTEPTLSWLRHGSEMTKNVAMNMRSPVLDDHSAFAMHFVAHDLAQMLRNLSISRGVKQISATIVDQAVVNDQCLWLRTDAGTLITADWYIDASGFRSLLIGRTSAQFRSYANDLLVDSAVVGPSAYTNPRDQFWPFTRISAHAAGWQFRIPTQTRIGNGLVYSSAHMDAATAEQDLRTLAGVGDTRHIRMRLGYHDQLIAGNVCAVGLSGGFIEPLEATAIHIAEQTLGWLVGVIRDHVPVTVANQGLARKIAYIKTLIMSHYAWCDRPEPFWQAAKAAAWHSGELAAFFDGLANGEYPTDRDSLDDAYPWCQWNELLRGFGQRHYYPTISNTAKTDIYMAMQSLPNHWDLMSQIGA